MCPWRAKSFNRLFVPQAEKQDVVEHKPEFMKVSLRKTPQLQQR